MPGLCHPGSRRLQKRKYSAQVTYWFGGFYSGTLDQIILSSALHPSSLLTVEVSAERDTGDLEEGRFTTTVVGTRARVNISPDLQFSSYVQYDTDSRSVATYSRLRWTFRPLGDLFVIYNRTFQTFRTAGNSTPTNCSSNFNTPSGTNARCGVPGQ